MLIEAVDERKPSRFRKLVKRREKSCRGTNESENVLVCSRQQRKYQYTRTKETHCKWHIPVKGRVLTCGF